MKLYILSGLLVLTACTAPDTPVQSDEELKAGVTATFTQYFRHLNDANYDSAFTYLADDKRFHWIEDGRIRYVAPEGMKRAYSQYKTRYQYQRLTIDTLDVQLLDPKTAAVTVEYDHLYRLNTGDSLYDHGTLSLTMKQYPAGWRILHGHSSIERKPLPSTLRPPK